MLDTAADEKVREIVGSDQRRAELRASGMARNVMLAGARVRRPDLCGAPTMAGRASQRSRSCRWSRRGRKKTGETLPEDLKIPPEEQTGCAVIESQLMSVRASPPLLRNDGAHNSLLIDASCAYPVSKSEGPGHRFRRRFW